MPIYLVEQRGVPGGRLVEATKPASAIEHVVQDCFICKRIDGRDLIEAARKYELEVAGAPKEAPEPDADDSAADAAWVRVHNDVDPDDTKPVAEPDPDALRDLRDDPAAPGPVEDDGLPY